MNRHCALYVLRAFSPPVRERHAQAGNQQYEPLAASVQAALHAAVADQGALDPSFQRSPSGRAGSPRCRSRLARRIPDEASPLPNCCAPCTTKPPAPGSTRSWCSA